MKSLSAAERLLSSNNVLDYCDAALFVAQAGKFWEMLYFAVLEACYWYYAFLRRSRLIEFRPTPFWRCCSEQHLNFADLAATLRLCGFSAVESPINWCVITESTDGAIFGSTHDRPHVLQRSDNLWSPPVELFEFSKPILAVFISRSNHLFVATKGEVYLSTNGGAHFDVALHLSDGDSFVWHNHGIDETPKGILIGEYGSIIDRGRTPVRWKSVAYLYLTDDDGKSWRRIDYLARNSTKHVHLVKYSRRFAQVLVTDGDKPKRSYWIGALDKMESTNFKKGRFDSLSRGGGHTAFAETDNATLLGTDHHGGTNSIISLRSSRDGSARMLPSPYRHSPVINMHSITFGARSITFASLYSGLRDQWKSALIYSDDDGDNWNCLLEYNGRYVEIHIANAQQPVSSSLAISFNNYISGEKRPSSYRLLRN